LASEVMALLPTPRARVDKEHGPDGKDWAELRPTVETAVHHQPLLPTPASADGERTSEMYGRGNPTLKGSLSSGATTNPLSADGKPSTAQPRPRLSPRFVGWMMGTPNCAECGREWTDPDCPHSATAFKSNSATCSAGPSSNSNGGGRETVADA
jgi:hypothetical protein